MDTHDLVVRRDTDNNVLTHPECHQLSLCVSMLTIANQQKQKQKKQNKGKARLMLVDTLLFFARNLTLSIGELLIKIVVDI